MGFGANALRRVIGLARRGVIMRPGAVAELGAQQIRRDFFEQKAELAELAKLFNIGTPFPLAADPTQRGDYGPPTEVFWRWLGFDYLSIDIGGSPGSLPLDLNYDALPDKHKGKYHLVTNFGTTEHVCNQFNAFKIVHELTAPNGVMMHGLPAQGFFNCGLLNYNPKFFWMLARSNEYNWLEVDYDVWRPEQVPGNILEQARMFTPEIEAKFAGYTAADCLLKVSLQKVRDIPFIAPFDAPVEVSLGGRGPSAELARRYWTIFSAAQ